MSLGMSAPSSTPKTRGGGLLTPSQGGWCRSSFSPFDFVSLSPVNNDRRRCKTRLIGQWKVKILSHSWRIFCLEHSAVAFWWQVKLHVIIGWKVALQMLPITSTQLYHTLWYIEFSMGQEVLLENEGVRKAGWDTAETSWHNGVRGREGRDDQRGMCARCRINERPFCYFVAVFCHLTQTHQGFSKPPHVCVCKHYLYLSLKYHNRYWVVEISEC